MPLTMSYPDPTADIALDHTYIWAAEVNLNFATQYGRIVYFVHRDEAAAYAGKDPIGVIAFDLTPAGVPALKNDVGETTEPAFPSFNELMYTNQEAYGSLAQAIYMLILSRPKYQTAILITRPTAIATSPSDNDTVATVTAVTITFNIDVDPTTIVFQLTDATGAAIPATMAYVNKVATFTVGPAPAGLCTATLNAVKTATKDSLPAPVSWTFTVT